MTSPAPADAACWQCGNAHPSGLVCEQCGSPQPLAVDIDLFTVLELPRTLELERADLERRYHAASMAVHPDRHQAASAHAQQLSMAASALVNRAYRTLRDPIARGKYWLMLHGVGLNNDKRVPPSIASLVFDTQEQLDELRHADATSAASHRTQVDAVRAEIDQQLAASQDALAAQYRAWSPAVAATAASLAALQSRLGEINYLRTLLGDVEEALGDPRGTDRRH